MSNKLLIESDAVCIRTGVDKNGRPWSRYEAYLDLGGKYPEKFIYFVNDRTPSLPSGFFEVPIVATVINGDLKLELDITKAVRVSKQAANPTQLSKA